MRIRSGVLVLGLAAFFSAPSAAQDASYHGTSFGNFLKIGLGARAAGMADAYVTFGEDASCLYWNPAASSRIGNPSVVFSNLQWLVETDLNYLALTVPFDFGTLGLDIAYFTSGDIIETTLQEQDGTGRVVSANDLAIGMTYARNFTDRFSFGLKLKFIREQLASTEASTFAFDVGSVFTTSFPGDITIGLSLSNFGSDMQFSGSDLLVTHVVPGSPTGKQVPAVLETQSWSLPLFFRLGLSGTVYNSDDADVVMAYTLIDSRDYEARHHLGAAVTFLDLLTIRGGYRFNYDEVTFSAGAGVKVDTKSLGLLSVDYAYTDFGDLKGVHQITLGVVVL